MENKMDELLGVIKHFAGSYAPINYMECDGRLLSIQQYTALFAILGAYYGGDGKSTFALPDLRPYTSVTYNVDVPNVNVNGNVGFMVNQSVSVTNGPRRPWHSDEPRYIICTEGLWPSRP